MSHAMEVIASALERADIFDSRLSRHGNLLLKTTELLLLQHNIFTGQLTHYNSSKLKPIELDILSGRLCRLEKSTWRLFAFNPAQSLRKSRRAASLWLVLHNSCWF